MTLRACSACPGQLAELPLVWPFLPGPLTWSLPSASSDHLPETRQFSVLVPSSVSVLHKPLSIKKKVKRKNLKGII